MKCKALAVVALVLLGVEMFRNPSLQNLALICLAFSVMVLVTISRAYTVRLQDRIIRLEMQLRLERLGHGPKFPRLSTRQLVALRFVPRVQRRPKSITTWTESRTFSASTASSRSRKLTLPSYRQPRGITWTRTWCARWCSGVSRPRQIPGSRARSSGSCPPRRPSIPTTSCRS